MAGKIVAIVQARMGSTRLPNKMMFYLHGYPIIEWVYRRLVSASRIDEILFALPKGQQDDVLAWYLESIGADCFRGSETDVVDRYYQAAKTSQAKTIVRVCADNPLICASEVDRLINFYLDSACDYAYNHIPKDNTYPDGIGAEICGMNVLTEIYTRATEENHREHLFNYVWTHSCQYRIMTFDPPAELAFPQLKLDIDTIEDYKCLLQRPYRVNMTAHQVVATTLQ